MKSLNTSTQEDKARNNIIDSVSVLAPSRGGMLLSRLAYSLLARQGHSSPRGKSGFTLIELLITLAIITFIAVIGIIVSIDSYQRYLLRSDMDKSAVLLQKARSSAINNVGESAHGIYFGDTDKFVLFKGSTYSPGDPNNLIIDKSPAVTVSGASEVVFEPVTANTSVVTLTVSDGARSLEIEINNEGGINW